MKSPATGISKRCSGLAERSAMDSLISTLKIADVDMLKATALSVLACCLRSIVR